MKYILALGILLIILLCLSACETLHVPDYKGKKSSHFDGKKFHDPNRAPMGNFWKLMWYKWTNKRAKWPTIEPTENTRLYKNKVYDEIQYQQINHGTVLVQHAGLNILTDPVYSKRASPFQWIGPKRYRQAAIPFEKLPPIDVVMISHDHYDHLDIKTLQRLRDQNNPRILVGLGMKAFLAKFDLTNVEEMDWQEVHQMEQVKFTFLPCKHWSNRFASPFKSLWGSWMISSPTKQIYFAGDTGFSNHFQDIKDTFQNIDLALIPIGAYVPRFFMKHVHMAPEDAMKAHQVLNPSRSLAIHWGTFQLTEEGMFDPIDELQVLKDSLKIDNFDYDRAHDMYYKMD